MELESLIQDWNGDAVVTRYDRPSGAWIFIALHDRTLGGATGGVRMRTYPSPAEGLNDALHLAEGMTHKWAAADLPFGGGKAVLAVPQGLNGKGREGLLRRFGRLVESLGGAFTTGEDLGTTPQDMAIIREETRHILGAGNGPGHVVDPGPFTSRGVFAALKAGLRAGFGDDDLSGRTVAIQGVGDVGAPLGRQLVRGGARVLLADVDEHRARKLARDLTSEGEEPAPSGASPRVEVIEPDGIYDAPCDVFAPCAVGFVLSEDTVPRLRCRVVTGSANNQLASPAAAEALHQRGILYAPDYVANSGGAIAFGMMAQGVEDRDILYARIDKLGDIMDEIYEEAAERKESPLHAAHRRVQRILAREERSAREPG